MESLNGKYITAEDVGTSTSDIEFIGMETGHVAGKPEQLGGGGDPSPRYSLWHLPGYEGGQEIPRRNRQPGRTKGDGAGCRHVGFYLVERLVKEGAKVMVSDINNDRLKKLTDAFQVEVVAADAVYDQQMDIYAPCALGATVNDDTISKLSCGIIAGAANNQLKEEHKHGEALVQRNITMHLIS